MRRVVRGLAVGIGAALIATAVGCRKPAPTIGRVDASTPTLPAASDAAAADIAAARQAVDAGPVALPPAPRHARALPDKSVDCTDPQWLAARIARVRAGKRELVRVPYVVSAFNGCSCPSDYFCMSFM